MNELHEKLQVRAEQIRKLHSATFNPVIPITLNVDGLCENPGAMHVGLYAKQGDQVLFAEHLAVGYGTCNEAEYIAVKSGLVLLKSAFPQPATPVQVFSDSQLVCKQVKGEWRASGQMQIYCIELRKFNRTYPFILNKVPREQNHVADSLAQKYISKNAGRCLSLDQGRFNASKQKVESVKKADLYNALMTQEAKKYFEQYNLSDDLKELKRLVSIGERSAATDLAREIEEKSVQLLEDAPKSNEILAMWMKNTIGIIQKAIPEMIKAIESGNEIDLDYYLEEMAGKDDTGDQYHGNVVDSLRNGSTLNECPILEGEEEESLC